MGYRQGRIEALALDGLGRLSMQGGQPAAAAVAYRQAVRITAQIGDLEGQLDARMHLGEVLEQLGEVAQATQELGGALVLAQTVGRPKAEVDLHRSLYQLHKRGGDSLQALDHFEQLYHKERELLGADASEQVSAMTSRFNLERAQHEAGLIHLRLLAAEDARREAEAQVQERTRSLELAQLEVVTRLAVVAEFRDDTTGQHTWRVVQYSAAIARRLGYAQAETELLSAAARLHDVGKIGISDTILLKPGKLTPEEYGRMQGHAEIGARMLSGGSSHLLRLAEQIAYSHHERWDGKGYPRRLSGEAIPLAARIVAVADVFDALTHLRPYKAAWSVPDALAELAAQSGIQFDPQVIEVALEVLSSVTLVAQSTGEGRQESA
ncbi:HD domain-containing phosphohydrolase [Deinococcus sp.]|uniref:HD-GYP domain-containing protein n=1 Tax=Deinococcus sp. TaxID=47478 RepID=UPI0025E42C11|nr:HD domain-containing phosphohydrolase [Deinococcus sp.]